MTTLRCPRDDTALRDQRDGTHRCTHCHATYELALLDASTTFRWDQHAPGAGAVLAVMAATEWKLKA